MILKDNDGLFESVVIRPYTGMNSHIFLSSIDIKWNDMKLTTTIHKMETDMWNVKSKQMFEKYKRWAKELD